MHKSMILAAVLMMSVPVVAQRTVVCNSINGKRHFCPANTKNGVVLLEERSDNVCEQGSTWSYTPRGIRVNGGCKAKFQLGGENRTNANGGYGNNGAGNNNDGSYRRGGVRTDENNGSSGNDGYGNRNGNGNNGNGYPDNDANGRRDDRNGYPNRNQNGYPNNQNGSSNQDNNPNGYGNNGYGNNGNDQNNGSGQNGYNNGYGNRQQAAVVIPSGTVLELRLEQAITPANVNQGDFIPMTLVKAISVEGRVVAPVGTAVQAKVVSAQGSPLDIRLDSLSANGQTYALVSDSIHSVRDSQNAPNGGNQTAGQVLGSVLGSLSGGAQLPSGSIYTFRLTSPARATATNR